MRTAAILVAFLLSACAQLDRADEGTVDEGDTTEPDPGPGEEDPMEPPPDDSEGTTTDPGIEPAGSSRRFDLVSPMCTVELFDSGGGCPSDDAKCLCKPEFDALNPAKGSPGNPDGRVIVIAQPRWGKREDGTWAFDAHAAIKERGNTVGHYVNELNPSASCTLAEAWTPDKGCSGGS